MPEYLRERHQDKRHDDPNDLTGNQSGSSASQKAFSPTSCQGGQTYEECVKCAKGKEIDRQAVPNAHQDHADCNAEDQPPLAKIAQRHLQWHKNVICDPTGEADV